VIIENCKSNSCKSIYICQEFRGHVFIFGGGRVGVGGGNFYLHEKSLQNE